jgi:Ca2+:H+ antiporter
MVMRFLLALIPISLVSSYLLHASPVVQFFLAVAAIVPLAEWIRRSTVELSGHTGSAIGSLLNVSFGNFAELVLALFVLRAGHAEVVKAQITGSIIGNGLLGLGLAALVGGLGRKSQVFKRENASRLSALMILSLIGLSVPALFDYSERFFLGDKDPRALDDKLSLAVSVVLIAVYLLNLVYTLITHRGVFDTDDEGEGHAKPTWSAKKAVIMLAVATVITSIEAEIASHAIEETASLLHLTTFFLGATVLAVVGNAAEYVSAVYFARKNQMGTTVAITAGSSIQLALLIAPLLVLVSHLMGQPMDLVFSNPLELVAVAGVVFAVNSIAHDGETTWFEGVLLLAVYVLLALAFFYATVA